MVTLMLSAIPIETVVASAKVKRRKDLRRVWDIWRNIRRRVERKCHSRDCIFYNIYYSSFTFPFLFFNLLILLCVILLDLHFRNRLNPRRFDEKTKMSEASQTINDTKSTVVMEFSTVQKVVQIVDNDSDVNSIRPPFKDIVIQKDTTDRKRDYNVEHNFESNLTAAENP